MVCLMPVNVSLFFFSSRRRHSISLCDWSSDVCSSDLQSLSREQALRTSFNQQKGETLTQNEAAINYRILQQEIETNKGLLDNLLQRSKENRSEERRVGKECRSRWWPYH